MYLIETNMKEVTAQEAIKSIKSGGTIVVGGSDAGHGVPDVLLKAFWEKIY